MGKVDYQKIQKNQEVLYDPKKQKGIRKNNQKKEIPQSQVLTYQQLTKKEEENSQKGEIFNHFEINQIIDTYESQHQHSNDGQNVQQGQEEANNAREEDVQYDFEQSPLQQKLQEISIEDDNVINHWQSLGVVGSILQIGLPTFSRLARRNIVRCPSLAFRAAAGCFYVQYSPVKFVNQLQNPTIEYLNKLINHLSEQKEITINSWRDLIGYGRQFQLKEKSLMRLSDEQMADKIRQNGKVTISFVKNYYSIYEPACGDLPLCYNRMTFYYNYINVGMTGFCEFIDVENDAPIKRIVKINQNEFDQEISVETYLDQLCKHNYQFSETIRIFNSLNNKSFALLLACFTSQNKGSLHFPGLRRPQQIHE